MRTLAALVVTRRRRRVCSLAESPRAMVTVIESRMVGGSASLSATVGGRTVGESSSSFVG